MNLINEFDPIRIWATEKGITDFSTREKQFLKLQEEVGELAKAILTNNREEVIDAIGDCVVVLTNIATFSNITIEECVNSAYKIINNRNGKMHNGAFVKEL